MACKVVADEEFGEVELHVEGRDFKAEHSLVLSSRLVYIVQRELDFVTNKQAFGWYV